MLSASFTKRQTIMENFNSLPGFLAITQLYLKMTESSEKVITEDEIELFIGSVDRSNLEMLGMEE